MIPGLKIRSFGVGCAHEIQLANGKHILIDPFFGPRESRERGREAITAADYILITHTHFDHDLAAGYLAKKFGSKVFVGVMSAMDFLKFHQIPYDQVFPVTPGQSFQLEDFTLQAWAAKHNPSGGKIYSPETDICKKETGIEGHQECDNWGSLESLDYMITTGNSLRILVASGRVIWDDLFEECRRQHPDILLRQSGMRKTGEDLFGGGQVSAPELAKVLVRYQAQLVIPFHYDVMIWKSGEDNVRKYFEDVKQEVERLAPGTSLLYPESWKWYQVGLGAEPAEG